MKDFNITGIPKVIFSEGKISKLADEASKFGSKILLITGGKSLNGY